MHKFAKLAFPLVAALALTACGGGAGGSEAGEMTTVRVAHVPTVTKAPMYLGIDQGFFEEENIVLEPEVVQDGAAVTAAVTSGSAELASAALAPTVTAVSQGVPVKIATTAAAASPPEGPTGSYGDAVLIVDDNSGIETVADLNGKTIAVNALQAGLELAVRGAVDRLGADSSTMEFLVVPFPEMSTALEQGQVDAIAPLEPFVSAAVEAGHRPLHHAFPYDPAELTQFVNSVYYTSTQYAEENADVVERTTRALKRANEYAQEHPEEVRQQIPEYTDLDEGLAEDIALPDFPSTRNDEAYQAEMELMVNYEFIPEVPTAEQLYVEP